MIVRHAGDSVLGFESKADVDRFPEDLKPWFARFGLMLNEDKTRVLQFGRFAAQARAKQGRPKPLAFDFLHPHPWEILVERLVPPEAADLGEADACPRQGDSTGADAPHARADPEGRPFAAFRGHGYSIRINASRHDSKQEPHVVVPHVPICTGGGEQSRFLRRPQRGPRCHPECLPLMDKCGQRRMELRSNFGLTSV
ncbi:MAG TPA: hypothetical protein PKB14_07455 [Rubrivivax sp.]|nr:hypothetical protein [Rubrivivax sp.]